MRSGHCMWTGQYVFLERLPCSKKNKWTFKSNTHRICVARLVKEKHRWKTRGKDWDAGDRYIIWAVTMVARASPPTTYPCLLPPFPTPPFYISAIAREMNIFYLSFVCAPALTSLIPYLEDLLTGMKVFGVDFRRDWMFI